MSRELLETSRLLLHYDNLYHTPGPLVLDDKEDDIDGNGEEETEAGGEDDGNGEEETEVGGEDDGNGDEEMEAGGFF